ncbi:MAG: hypothetical protein ACRD96_14110 [Bryobacteraceae bacterium]
MAALIVTTAVAFASLACAAGRDDRIQMALFRRFQPSRIEIQDPAHRGMVVRQGKVLTLMGDGVSAKPFRVTRADPASPSVHVMDFARVEVSADGRVRAEAGGLALPKGTRVVVLDVIAKGDRAHLLLHTAEPIAGPSSGEPVYGCTEFVFQIPLTVVRGGDVEPLLQLIERSLEWSPEQRICAPGNAQLCLQPA